MIWSDVCHVMTTGLLAHMFSCLLRSTAAYVLNPGCYHIVFTVLIYSPSSASLSQSKTPVSVANIMVINLPLMGLTAWQSDNQHKLSMQSVSHTQLRAFYYITHEIKPPYDAARSAPCGMLLYDQCPAGVQPSNA